MVDDPGKKSVDGLSIFEAVSDNVPTLVQLWIEQHNYHVEKDQDYYEPTSEKNIHDAREYFRNAVENGKPQILLAKIGDNIIGFISFEVVTRSPGVAKSGSKIKEYGEVVDLFVKSSHRSQGIGEQLMIRAEQYFHGQEVKFMMVEVSSSNPGAQKFYEKGGFKPLQVEMFKQI